MIDEHKKIPRDSFKGRLHSIVSNTIKGWVYDTENPNSILTAKMYINGKSVETKRSNLYRHDLFVNKIGNGDHAFEFVVPIKFRNGANHIIEVLASNPNGTPYREKSIGVIEYNSEHVQEITPLILQEKTNRVSNYLEYNKSYELMSVRKPRISVVIPVFNALDKTIECLHSIKKYTSADVEVILINDFSTDENIRTTLDKISLSMNFKLYHNEKNLGFTATASKGMLISGRNDVVLLNSDTRVTKNWLINLTLAAHSGYNVATSTPLSDNAGPFTAVNSDRLKSIGWTDDEICQLVRDSSNFNWIETPTAHGFCMYIRRDCIDDIGLLDVDAFPKGYGEENDFSMRAIRRGWKHIVDDRTIVFHAEAASFGEAKSYYLKMGRQIIDEKYPEYKSLVNKFVKSEHLADIKQNIRANTAYMYAKKGTFKKKLFFVINKLTGGTPQTTLDLATQLQDLYDCYALRSDGNLINLDVASNNKYSPIESFDIGDKIEIASHKSSNYDKIVSGLLIKYSPDIVHIRQIGLHSIELVRICKNLHIPIIYSFHDFYSICPNTKLIDNHQVYCGGKCTDSEGDCSVELWPRHNVPSLKNNWVFKWRQDFSDLLRICDKFITTSPYAAEVIQNNLDVVKSKGIQIIPHGRDFSEFYTPKIPSLSDRIRILIPGNISGPKGALIIKRLKELDIDNKIEIHIIGNISKELRNADIIYHGPYARDEAVEKFRSIDAHIGAIFSIWPETYCHTLTEMWASGLPVLGFDIGAVGERLHSSKAGWAVPIMPAENLIKIIFDIFERKKFESAMESVSHWQNNEGKTYGIQAMANQYITVYSSLT